jgi:hypothetical protein
MEEEDAEEYADALYVEKISHNFLPPSVIYLLGCLTAVVTGDNHHDIQGIRSWQVIGAGALSLPYCHPSARPAYCIERLRQPSPRD